MLEELNHFLKFLLGFISPGNILEVDLDLIRTAHAGTALAKGHDPAATALRLLHNEEPYTDEQENRQQGREHRGPPGWFRRIFRIDLYTLCSEFFKELGVAVRRIRSNRRKLRTIRQRTTNGILNEDNLCNLAFIHLLQEIRVSHFLLRCVPCRKVVNDGNRDQNNQQIEPYIA